MKRATILTLLLTLSGCVTAATERSMSVSQVNMTEKEQLQYCEYLGIVKGWSSHGGWIGRQAGETSSINSALEKASELGASHVLWTGKTYSFGTGVEGKAYKCKER